MNYFITGTDTDIGKTYFSVLLTKALRAAGHDTVALKPICCGPREDSHRLREAADNELAIDEVNPVWFKTPVSPYVASTLENEKFDFDDLVKWYTAIRAKRESILVEGAGGWLVPLDHQHTIADLASAFDLPILVVVANRLGCINHTLLTVESIQSRGLECAGLVLNTMSIGFDKATETNKDALQDFCKVPILFELTYGQTEIALDATQAALTPTTPR